MSQDTTTPTFPPWPRLTFSIKIEFLVPWIYNGSRDPHGHVKGLPPAFRIERYHDFRPYEAGFIILDEVRNLFKRYHLPTKARTNQFDSDFAKKVLGGYTGWGVDDSPSVQEPLNDGVSGWVDKYFWVALEIQSPIEYDTPRAFEAIEYARKLLLATYRIHINPSCGLHVHVGYGVERFPLGAMQRIASLVFATEPLLVTLNHPWRQADWNSQTLRDRSNLSNLLASDGSQSPLCDVIDTSPFEDASIEYLASDVRHGEMPISWREQNQEEEHIAAFEKTRQKGHFEAFYWREDNDTAATADIDGHVESKYPSFDPRVEKIVKETMEKLSNLPSKPNSPARKRTIPRLANPRYTTEQLQGFSDKLTEYGCAALEFSGESAGRAPGPGVFEGVGLICSSRNSCEIAHLMRTPKGTGMVNFDAYSYYSFWYSVPGGRRTIEFRGAEGTLDGWAVTWAKICVALVKFAVWAPTEEFVRVLGNCELAAREDGLYDCIDLLDDLCLFAEAVVAERRIVQRKEDWGLRFVGEE